jgi:glutamine amidotransferase
MCRLAAYSGPTLPLRRLLIDPRHSLLRQSWAPREMREAALNADGFGFGWYRADGAPLVYTNTCPIWADPNLEDLASSLESGIWLANVRSATPGQGSGHANTQPFRSGRILFQHNGLVREFREQRRAAFHGFLRPAVQAQVRGDTDSEYLFALFRQSLEDGKNDLKAALSGMVQTLAGLLDGGSALLNLAISDGGTLLACRHAINDGDCPTLYVADDLADFADAVVIASERFCDSTRWRALDPGTFIAVRGGRIVETGTL